MKSNIAIKALNPEQNKIIMDFQELLRTCEIIISHHKEGDSTKYVLLATNEDIILRYEYEVPIPVKLSINEALKELDNYKYDKN